MSHCGIPSGVWGPFALREIRTLGSRKRLMIYLLHDAGDLFVAGDYDSSKPVCPFLNNVTHKTTQLNKIPVRITTRTRSIAITIDVCCITETWLKPTIPSSLLCPPNFSIIRKDRTNCRGGGVAILCRNDWRMQLLPDLDNPFECLWTKIITQNSEFFVATIDHPPDYECNEQDLIEFLIDSCKQLLLSKPNSNIIIAGDINN